MDEYMEKVRSPTLKTVGAQATWFRVELGPALSSAALSFHVVRYASKIATPAAERARPGFGA